jgi:hypothetical protein
VRWTLFLLVYKQTEVYHEVVQRSFLYPHWYHGNVHYEKVVAAADLSSFQAERGYRGTIETVHASVYGGSRAPGEVVPAQFSIKGGTDTITVVVTDYAAISVSTIADRLELLFSTPLGSTGNGPVSLSSSKGESWQAMHY